MVYPENLMFDKTHFRLHPTAPGFGPGEKTNKYLSGSWDSCWYWGSLWVANYRSMYLFFVIIHGHVSKSMERCCSTYVSDQVHIRVSLSAERSCLRNVLELWTPIVLGDRPRMDRTVVKTLMISPSLCTKLSKLEHFMHSVHSKLFSEFSLKAGRSIS